MGPGKFWEMYRFLLGEIQKRRSNYCNQQMPSLHLRRGHRETKQSSADDNSRAEMKKTNFITASAREKLRNYCEDRDKKGGRPVIVHLLKENLTQMGYGVLEGFDGQAALQLAKTAKPSDKDIDAAMNGNLCRCGTYLRVRQAIHKAASMATTKITQAAARNGSGK